MSVIHAVIAEHLTEDPDQTAEAVVQALRLPSRFADLFMPLLLDECRRQSRALTRCIERGHCVEQDDDESNVESEPNGRHASRFALLNRHFYNGRLWVRYGEATVADHEGRITYMLSFRSGIDRDIEFHRRLIADIVAAGVSCLDEIEDWDPVAA